MVSLLGASFQSQSFANVQRLKSCVSILFSASYLSVFKLDSYIVYSADMKRFILTLL